MRHDNPCSVTMYRDLLAYVPESMNEAFRLQESEPDFLSSTAFCKVLDQLHRL